MNLLTDFTAWPGGVGAVRFMHMYHLFPDNPGNSLAYSGNHDSIMVPVSFRSVILYKLSVIREKMFIVTGIAVV